MSNPGSLLDYFLGNGSGNSANPPTILDYFKAGAPALVPNPASTDPGATALGGTISAPLPDLSLGQGASGAASIPSTQGAGAPAATGTNSAASADGAMAWSPDDGKTIYVFQPGDMSLEKRTGGTVSWRDNSPGNLGMSRQAEIGHYDSFPPITQGGAPFRRAIYDNAQDGLASLSRYVFDQGAPGETIAQMITNRYATGSGDNAPAYVADVSNKSGLPAGTALDSLSTQQRVSLLNAIQNHEKWQPGSSQYLTANGWQ